jgi:hypothetical protein
MYMYSCRNSKNIIKFFESSLLGFRDEQEYDAKCHKVQAGVEGESALKKLVSTRA